MATFTAYLGGTNADLSGGADFNKYLEPATETAGSISVSVAKSATDTSYAFTRANNPNNADWQTGTIVVKVNLSVASSDMYLKVNAHRINSAGTIQESMTATAEQQLSSTGTYTFTLSSKDWTAGNATDRIRVDYIFRNSKSNATRSVTVTTGTTNTSVTTAINTPSTYGETGRLSVLVATSSGTAHAIRNDARLMVAKAVCLNSVGISYSDAVISVCNGAIGQACTIIRTETARLQNVLNAQGGSSHATRNDARLVEVLSGCGGNDRLTASENRTVIIKSANGGSSGVAYSELSREEVILSVFGCSTVIQRTETRLVLPIIEMGESDSVTQGAQTYNELLRAIGIISVTGSTNNAIRTDSKEVVAKSIQTASVYKSIIEARQSLILDSQGAVIAYGCNETGHGQVIIFRFMMPSLGIIITAKMNHRNVKSELEYRIKKGEGNAEMKPIRIDTTMGAVTFISTMGRIELRGVKE